VRQIGPFCTLQPVDTKDPEADQNGGYSRGRAKAQVALRDRLPVSLRPLSAESQLPTGRVHGRGLVPVALAAVRGMQGGLSAAICRDLAGRMPPAGRTVLCAGQIR
jgi:hypothetical protein